MHHCGVAVAEKDIGPGALVQHETEILGPHHGRGDAERHGGCGVETAAGGGSGGAGG